MTDIIKGTKVDESIRLDSHLSQQFINTFVAGDATPSVMDCEVHQAVTGVTITNFDDGQEGQTIKIIGVAGALIANNSNIVCGGGQGKSLRANQVYTFTLINGVWLDQDVLSIGAHTLIQSNEVTVSSAADVTLFLNVSAAIVLVRNFSVGGAAAYLLDSTFSATGVLIGSNGGAIWAVNAAPLINEIRIFLSGVTVVCRAGANRNGNALVGTLIRFGGG